MGGILDIWLTGKTTAETEIMVLCGIGKESEKGRKRNRKAHNDTAAEFGSSRVFVPADPHSDLVD